MAEPDYYERLGLPRRFSFLAADLERNYLARSREIHPDRAGEAPEVLDASARLNEAYATLRDPFRRAEYLLSLLGGPGATEVKQAPPEFLEEMLELRMSIEEAKHDPAARAELERELSERRARLLDAVARQLDEPPPNLLAIRMQLNAMRYVNGLLRDLSED